MNTYKQCSLFVEVMGDTARLAYAAVQKLKFSFRIATMNQHTRMFCEFLSLLEKAQISPYQVKTINFLAYMEFLHQKGLSQPNISNHLAGIRAMFIDHGLNTSPFRNERFSLFIKSLRLNAPLSLRGQKIITIDLLQQTIVISEVLNDPLVFKSLYVFTFFSFLRLSNVLPHSAKQFNPTRHLTRGDLLFSEKFSTLIVKWSKTLQNRNQMTTMTIPDLGHSILCPI